MQRVTVRPQADVYTRDLIALLREDLAVEMPMPLFDVGLPVALGDDRAR